MNTKIQSGLAIGTLAMLSAATHADVIASLQTDQLPSQQAGWAYIATGIHGAVAESDIFSPDTSVMTVNTMGQAIANSPGSAFASFDTSATTVDGGIVTATLTARTRIAGHPVPLRLRLLRGRGRLPDGVRSDDRHRHGL